MQEAPETPSTLLREYTIPFGMIEVPSLLPYLWITNIEGIVKVWARRVIKSSLVGDHFASPASFRKRNRKNFPLQGCDKGGAELPPTPIKSAVEGTPKMAWHPYQTGPDHLEASIYEPLHPMN
jgi:hypothetical protein